MKKVAVIGLDTIKEKLISDLMELGVVEITDQTQRFEEDNWKSLAVKDGNEDKVAELDAKINRISLALDTLEKYSVEKNPLFSTRRVVDNEEFKKELADDKKIYGDIEHVLELNEKIHHYNDQINKLNADLTSVLPWEAYDLPLEVTETKSTIVSLGVVPSTVDMEKVKKQVLENTAETLIREVNSDKDLIYLAVIMLKEHEDETMNILKQNGFTPAVFKGITGTPIENKGRFLSEIKELENDRNKVQKEISTLGHMKQGIECVHDEVTIERDKEKIKEKLIKTKRTFNLEGWVPIRCEEPVKNVLMEHECCFAFREPLEEEEVPILISNNSFVQPFEAITDMYSLPDYRGIDPTKYFSLFYIMFFGIMLSDAGYGLVIAIASAIVLKKFRLEGMTYKMIKSFFFCGLSTVFWGAMFGSWFGDLFQVTAKTFFNKEIVIEPLWFNPLDDPTRLLIWSLIFGVIHLFLGMGLNAAMLIKEGKWIDAICDVGSWYLVILGAAMWLAGGSVSQAIVKPGMYMLIAGAAMLLLTGGRKNKGFGKITGGLSSLYDSTGYLSDILSYARLLALGLATAVIAQVVNMMGTLAGGGILGAIVLLIAFAVGHTFNLAINALGALVHSSRLQYIEFFSKFYRDGGEEFQPFRKNTKYVRLVNDTDGGKK